MPWRNHFDSFGRILAANTEPYRVTLKMPPPSSTITVGALKLKLYEQLNKTYSHWLNPIAKAAVAERHVRLVYYDYRQSRRAIQLEDSHLLEEHYKIKEGDSLDLVYTGIGVDIGRSRIVDLFDVRAQDTSATVKCKLQAYLSEEKSKLSNKPKIYSYYNKPGQVDTSSHLPDHDFNVLNFVVKSTDGMNILRLMDSQTLASQGIGEGVCLMLADCSFLEPIDTGSALSPPHYALHPRQMPERDLPLDSCPLHMLCPITQVLMKDPVIAQDGYCYERSAIEKWFSSGHLTSPMTNLPIASASLYPNTPLLNNIEDWVRGHKTTRAIQRVLHERFGQILTAASSSKVLSALVGINDVVAGTPGVCWWGPRIDVKRLRAHSILVGNMTPEVDSALQALEQQCAADVAFGERKAAEQSAALTPKGYGFGPFEIFVKIGPGYNKLMVLRVLPTQTIGQIKMQIGSDPLILGGSASFNGRYTKDDDSITVSELGLQSNDLLLFQLKPLRGSIGIFGKHNNTVGVNLLHTYPMERTVGEPPSGSPYLTSKIIASLGADPDATFITVPDAFTVLSEEKCLALRRLVDSAWTTSGTVGLDYKHSLTRQALSNAIGAEALALLEAYMEHHYTKIILRRCASHGNCIKFHIDADASRTLQIPLNGEAEYEGGRLLYLTRAGGISCPPRPGGSMTVHDDTIAHGVTMLKSGVRYGLFLLRGHVDNTVVNDDVIQCLY